MLSIAAFTAFAGCASEEIRKYGDPAEVAGGVGGSSSTGTTTTSAGGGGGAMCEPTCDVSFQTDIFPVLDTAAKCADTAACHSTGKGNLTLIPGDSASYYTALTTYMLEDPAGAYIVPCDPDQSKIICNLQLNDNSNTMPCGTGMPLNPADGPTPAQLQDIKDWIACGAKDN